MQESFLDLDEKNSEIPHRVLAIKHRPLNFNEIIGQEAIVKTLRNAITTKKTPHALLLHGIRGTGKTTLARIIARSLNCLEREGANPCGICSNCISGLESRHPDILEMDAASHTGVNDIRDLIENIKYKPVSSPYKVYIIDEVHMLSNSAFNALLKTLEEPPLHVKFIFATTEVQKIPVTVLSRCQRFDLKRLTHQELKEHYNNLLIKESIEIEEAALSLIVNVAQGSVRDGLSILEQAISISSGSSMIKESVVRDMLGLVNIDNIIDIFRQIIAGDIRKVLKITSDLYKDGADASMIIEELLRLAHNASMFKALGNLDNTECLEDEKQFLSSVCKDLSVPFLAHFWQLLLRGYEEIKMSLRQFDALEMVLIRLTYFIISPSPESLLKQLSGESNSNIQTATSGLSAAHDVPINIKNPSDLLKFAYDNSEMTLYHKLKNDIGILEAKLGYIKIAEKNSKGGASTTLWIISKLKELTGCNWTIEGCETSDILTLNQIEQQELSKEKIEIVGNSLVQEILNTFDGLTIGDIKNIN